MKLCRVFARRFDLPNRRDAQSFDESICSMFEEKRKVCSNSTRLDFHSTKIVRPSPTDSTMKIR